MKQAQYIKKAISVPLYLIVVYYLLPFRPMYLYYSAQHNPTAIFNELKKEKANQNNAFSLNKQFSQNNDTFPKKDKVRFFIKTGFFVTSTLSDNFVFFGKDQIQTFLHPSYEPPLILFSFNRGPPLV